VRACGPTDLLMFSWRGCRGLLPRAVQKPVSEEPSTASTELAEVAEDKSTENSEAEESPKLAPWRRHTICMRLKELLVAMNTPLPGYTGRRANYLRAGVFFTGWLAGILGGLFGVGAPPVFVRIVWRVWLSADATVC
jgi:hypothetical protein